MTHPFPFREVPGPELPARPPSAYPPVPMVYDDRSGQALADRLLERRIVMVGGFLDAAASTDAGARLLLLDGGSGEAVQLHLSCPDGDLDAAMALADTVELLDAEVHAVATGLVGGPAVLPFAVASRREARPHAAFRLSEPRIELSGSAGRLRDEADEVSRRMALFVERLTAATNRPIEEVAAAVRRGHLLPAGEAAAWGLVG